MSVFISGSRSIKELPRTVKKNIDQIAFNGLNIHVGDASGVDALVQDYCLSINYHNVTVYSIYLTPRYIREPFYQEFIQVDSTYQLDERVRQTFKDAAMTKNSEFSLVVWDGKSRGSLNNISRSLHSKQKIKVWSSLNNRYIPSKKLFEMIHLP